MSKKTTVAIAHSDSDLGKPAEYTKEQLALVKDMIRQVADQTMGGMHNIVKPGDKVLIKINTVIPVAAERRVHHRPAHAGGADRAREGTAAVAHSDRRTMRHGRGHDAGDGSSAASRRSPSAPASSSARSNTCRSTCTRSIARSALTNSPCRGPCARPTYISGCRR